MAYSSVTIEFLDFPPIDEIITVNESFMSLSMSETFKELRQASLQITVPTYDEFAGRYIGYLSNNFKTAFDLDHNVSNLFTVTTSTGFLYQGKGTVVITANYEGAVFSVSSSPYYTSTADTPAYTPPEEVIGQEGEVILPAIVFPDAIVLSRSPFFISETPYVAFDEIRASLYIYRGDKVADKPTIPNYSLSKRIVLALQPTISFDIHKLVNDFVKNNYNNTLGSGASTTSSLDTVWCYVDAEIYQNYTFKYRIKQQLLITDGFGYTTELANPTITKKVLSSINEHVIYTGSDYPLYFITKDLVSITVNNMVIPFSFNQSFNNQIIGYVNISDYINSSLVFNAVFVYNTETITHTFNIKEECRFTVINCVFKNKFGMWQTIPFNKLSKKSIDFENSDYTGLIATYGNYNLSQHEKKIFLLNGKEKVTVNTDFIAESYNELFTELMLSEFIYLEENGLVLPVNLLKKTFEKKTKLNNRLIQYTMDFEYSFKLMNTIL